MTDDPKDQDPNTNYQGKAYYTDSRPPHPGPPKKAFASGWADGRPKIPITFVCENCGQDRAKGTFCQECLDMETHEEGKRPPIACFEEDIDAGLAIARELATLRQFRAEALRAAAVLSSYLVAIRSLLGGIGDMQADAALKLASEALDTAVALRMLAGGGQ